MGNVSGFSFNKYIWKPGDMDDFLEKYIWPKLISDERENSNRTITKKKMKKNYESSILLEKVKAHSILNVNRGFPGGAVVENPPANAGDTGSSPGLGGSHMPRSNWAREPQLLSLCVWNHAPQWEAVTVRGPRTAMKSGPRSPQLEKALAQKRRPNTAKNK